MMTYDPVWRQVLSVVPQGLQDSQTWTWTAGGTTWEQKSPSLNPRVSYGALAFNERDSTAVLFSGLFHVQRTTYTDNTTWIWDGMNWTAPLLQVQPPARFSASMVYDALHQKVVLFG